MRTSFETISDVELKVSVEVPSESVDAEFARQLKGVRKKARIKGFRPGKAPANMVKRLYADFLASETARVLISETVGKALEEIPRQVLGDPAFEPAAAREGQALEYAIFVQVKPELTIDGWEGMEIEVAPAEVEAGAVDARIEQTREQHKEQVPVEDRGADTGDVLNCRCKKVTDFPMGLFARVSDELRAANHLLVRSLVDLNFTRSINFSIFTRTFALR